MPDYMNDLVDKRGALDDELQAINERAAAEARALTEAEDQSAKDLLGRIAIIDERLSMAVSTAEATRKARALAERAAEFAGTRTERREGRPVERTTWGQAFVDSDQFRSYRGVGQSAPFDVDGYLETRAAITTADLAIPHFILPPVEVAATKAPLLELCNRVTVSSGVVDWVLVGADPVAAVVVEGQAKPEATFTMTPKSESLVTIAHWMQITRQALEDAPYMRSLIEGKLRRGLLAKAEADMAAALVAATLPSNAGATLLESIRAGIGKVEAAGYRPNAVVLNPADYATLDISVMGVSDDGPVRGQSFWGLTAVAVSSQPAGTATVGDFMTGATLFDRGVTSVFVTDSHASLFISNILVILAEARLKSAVTDLAAFCECTKTP